MTRVVGWVIAWLAACLQPTSTLATLVGFARRASPNRIARFMPHRKLRSTAVAPTQGGRLNEGRRRLNCRAS
jgi:hypothetical protein